MRFSHGPSEYRIVVTDHPILDASGQSCDGLCHHDDQAVYLSSSLSPARAEFVLRHELAHVWQEITAIQTPDEEILAIHMSSFAGWYQRQFASQNGPKFISAHFLKKMMGGG